MRRKVLEAAVGEQLLGGAEAPFPVAQSMAASARGLEHVPRKIPEQRVERRMISWHQRPSLHTPPWQFATETIFRKRWNREANARLHKRFVALFTYLGDQNPPAWNSRTANGLAGARGNLRPATESPPTSRTASGARSVTW